MNEDTLKLNFRGYWRAVNIGNVPNEAGIFCVYSCTNNSESNTVELHELLYVGESDHVRDCISFHNQFAYWLMQLRQSQELCFSFASIEGNDGNEDRKRIKATLVQKYNPKLNSNDSIEIPQNYGSVNFITEGANWGIRSEFHESQPQVQFSH